MRPLRGPAGAGAGSRLVLFLTVFIHLLGFGIIVPLLPYYALTYGAGGVAVGLLATSFSLTQFVFAPLWGRLSDRVGRRPVLLGSLLVTGASYVLFGLAQSLPLLFASRMLAGIAAAVLSTAQAYMADTTPPAERTKGMALIGAAFGLGFVFGPAMGGILSRFGFAVPAFVAAALAFTAAGFALFWLPESLPRAARSLPVERRGRLSIQAALRRPIVGRVLALFFVGTLSFSGMEAILALFCERSYGWGPRDLGYLLAFVGVVAAGLQVGVVGALARQVGERRLVRAGFLLMGGAFLGAGFAPPLPIFIAAMAAVALGNGLTTPSLSGLASMATPPEEQGSVLGAYQSLGSLGRAVGPLLGGLAFDHLGTGAPLWAAGAALVAAAAGAAALPRRPGGAPAAVVVEATSRSPS